jgi:hypothetical protein
MQRIFTSRSGQWHNHVYSANKMQIGLLRPMSGIAAQRQYGALSGYRVPAAETVLQGRIPATVNVRLAESD